MTIMAACDRCLPAFLPVFARLMEIVLLGCVPLFVGSGARVVQTGMVPITSSSRIQMQRSRMSDMCSVCARCFAGVLATSTECAQGA